jgi:hypothetical protein
MKWTKRRNWSAARTPYYPSQYVGHQSLFLDDRNMVGRPR